MLMVVAANSGFKLAFVDIRAAFLLSKVLDRDMFIKRPYDIEKPGIIFGDSRSHSMVWKIHQGNSGYD